MDGCQVLEEAVGFLGAGAARRDSPRPAPGGAGGPRRRGGGGGGPTLKAGLEGVGGLEPYAPSMDAEAPLI